MGIKKIGLGGSCHWCTEAIFQSLIGVEEVLQGWIAATNENERFSEAVIISYNENAITLKTLIEIHLHTHSCTSNHSMREKYRSAIYYFNLDQKEEANKALSKLQSDFQDKILTQIIPYKDFKLNKEEQLNYYLKNPEKPFCQNMINPKLKLIMKTFSKAVNHEKLSHLKESKIGLGTAAIGRPLYINIKEENNRKKNELNFNIFKEEGLTFLNEAFKAGVTHFDSSPGYGIAEEMLIDFSKDKSLNDLSISTKWGYTYVANFNEKAKTHEIKDHSLEKLNEQWKNSKRLLPFLKTYQIHSVTTDSDVLGNKDVINRLIEIKNKYNLEIGLSTSGEDQIEVIKQAISLNNKTNSLFSTFQVTFNLLDQSLLTIKDEIKFYNIIIKESLANGRIIASKNDRYAALQKKLALLAQKYRVTEDAIAIRYCMDAINGSIVLIGANNLKHLNQNLKARTFKLTNQEISELKSFEISPKDYWEERKKLVWN